MVASAEDRLTMLVVHTEQENGFYIALVPTDLSSEEVDAELKELGVEVTGL